MSDYLENIFGHCDSIVPIHPIIYIIDGDYYDTRNDDDFQNQDLFGLSTEELCF